MIASFILNFEFTLIILERRQSKMSILSTNEDQKSLETEFSKNTVSREFVSASVDYRDHTCFFMH